MLYLYDGGGSKEIDDRGVEPAWAKHKPTVLRLLKARRHDDLVGLLVRCKSELHAGTNGFGDEFHYLSLTVTLEEYVALEEKVAHRRNSRSPVYPVAKAVDEVAGVFVRFVVATVAREEEDDEPLVLPEAVPATVRELLADLEALLATRSAASAVDRAHTLIHGYLQDYCDRHNIGREDGDTVQKLFKRIRANHETLSKYPRGAPDGHVLDIGQAIATALDSLNHVRNRGSLSHPNPLIGEPEAMLCIRLARALLSYLEEHDGAKAGAVTGRALADP